MKVNKNIINKLIITAVLAVGLAAPTFLTSTASAALFSGAKQDACKGASLNGGACSSPAELNSNTNAAQTKLESTLANIINLLTVIVGIAAVITIIVNGLRLITSNGDSNSISSARNGIIYAVVGLIIVGLAQMIVRFVVQRT